MYVREYKYAEIGRAGVTSFCELTVQGADDKIWSSGRAGSSPNCGGFSPQTIKCCDIILLHTKDVPLRLVQLNTDWSVAREEV